MNLYVMRHGTTVWNERGIIQGRSNNRLSKQGIELTRGKSANQIKDVNFDIILSSPLMRTMQTANIVNQFHKVKIVKDLNLIEIDQGKFTGRVKNSLSNEEQMLKNQRSKEAGMETYQECYQRTKNFVDKIKQEKNFENVLVVTHNVVATFIEDIILGKQVDFNDDKFLRNFKNAEVKK